MEEGHFSVDREITFGAFRPEKCKIIWLIQAYLCLCRSKSSQTLVLAAEKFCRSPPHAIRLLMHTLFPSAIALPSCRRPRTLHIQSLPDCTLQSPVLVSISPVATLAWKLPSPLDSACLQDCALLDCGIYLASTARSGRSQCHGARIVFTSSSFNAYMVTSLVP